MWARVVEIMLACWLAVSPFVFKHGTNDVLQWSVDLTAGLSILLLAIFSFWYPTRYAHVGNILVSCLLIFFGYSQSLETVSPALQNELLIGILIFMFAIIPCQASSIPKVWEDYLRAELVSPK